jgi:hypothetical protein
LDPVTQVLSISAFIVVGSFVVISWGYRVGVVAPVVVALVSRLAYGLGQYAIGGIGQNDGLSFDASAVAIAQHWNGLGPPVELPIGKEAFPTFLAFLYNTFGHLPELGIIVNCVAAAALPIVMVLICRSLGWFQAERYAAWIVVLWPALFLWGPLLVRESLIMLTLAVALLGTVRARERKLDGLLMLLASALLLIGLRGGLGYLVAIVLPACLALEAIFSRSMRVAARATAIGVLGAGLVVAASVITPAVESADYFDADRRAQVAQGLDAGSTSFSQAGEGFTGGLSNLPSIMFGPFPWQITSPGLLVVGIDAILWLFMWLFAVRGILSLRVKAASVYCWLPTLALVYYLSTTATNFGLIMRLRALGIPFIAPLAAVGIAVFLERRRQLRRSKDHSVGTPHRDYAPVSASRTPPEFPRPGPGL